MSTIERLRRKRCSLLQASAAPSPCNDLKRLPWLRRLVAGVSLRPGDEAS